MATKRKSASETQRPWRRAGAELRRWLCCPLCRSSALQTIAYRESSTRFECRSCALRFSLSPLDVANTLREQPAEVAASMGRSAEAYRAGEGPLDAIREAAVASRWEDYEGAEPRRRVEMMLQVLRDAGTTIGAAVARR